MSLLRTSWLNFAKALWEREAIEKLDAHGRIRDDEGNLINPRPNPHPQYMLWSGVWGAGRYSPHQVVRDGNWTMVCINPTTDRAAPQPQNNERWVTDVVGTLSFINRTNTSGVYLTGARYTFQTKGALVRGFRWWAPENTGDFTYELWITSSADGRLQQIQAPTVPTISGAWLEFPYTAIFPQGSTLDLILVVRSVTLPNTFSAVWQTKNENSNPGSGEAIFRNNETEVRIHNTDKNDIDQEANLSSIEVGALMTIAGVTWTVVDITTAGSGAGGRHNFFVQPSQGRPPEAEQPISWDWGTTDPVPYVEDTDFYSGEAQVQGFDGMEYPPSVLTENAHGVDLNLDDVEASADWDLVAFSTVGI